MQADLIIYAVVAAGLVFWLRSVLGTRHGGERDRPNPFDPAVRDKAAEETRKAAMGDEAIEGDFSEISAAPILPGNVAISGEPVEKTLSDIALQDKFFDLPKFAVASQDAFVMIVEAFAQKDRELLEDLLEPQVFKAFDAAIADRNSRSETMETQIHAVKRADIVDARIEGRMAYVTVHFIAEETCVIRDADGNIIFGNSDRVTEMNDVWTFSREMRSNDPRWMLHETRDGDEASKNLIPDSV